jgi:hypothetical protein
MITSKTNFIWRLDEHFPKKKKKKKEEEEEEEIERQVMEMSVNRLSTSPFSH